MMLVRHVSRWVVAMALVARGAHAQQFDHPGSYAYVPDTGQLPLIKQAVDHGVSGMLPTPKRIARHRLMDADKIPGVLSVIVGSDSVGTQQDSGKAMTLPRSGVTIKWDDGNGNVCKARETVVADTLTQYCDAGSGQSAYQYIFEDETRRFRMVVHITSSHLGGPVDYALEFHTP